MEIIVVLAPHTRVLKMIYYSVLDSHVKKKTKQQAIGWYRKFILSLLALPAGLIENDRVTVPSLAL